jgi:hypothetical protein
MCPTHPTSSFVLMKDVTAMEPAAGGVAAAAMPEECDHKG